MNDITALEQVLLDYIERYGLTERARQLFLTNHEDGSPVHAESQSPDQVDICQVGRQSAHQMRQGAAHQEPGKAHTLAEMPRESRGESR